MDVLQKRVLDRMNHERKTLRDDQMRLGHERKALTKAAQKAIDAQAKLLGALGDGKTPTKAVRTAGEAAPKAVGAALRKLTAITEQMGTNAAALTLLDDPAERDRRVACAQELGVTDKPLTGVEAAEMILIREGRPRHITDLTREVLETGIVKLSGKTPQQTMSAYLAKEAAKVGGRFVRVAPGVFDIRRDPVPAAS